MSNIVNKIKKIPNLYHSKGCTTTQIKDAQNKLEVEFSEEYIEYIKAYGAISFYGTEWTGLNIDSYLNVIEVTKQERELNNYFPRDCFVIENQGIDGLIIVSNQEGHIFGLKYNKKELICESLSDYLEICIDRKKLIEK